MVDSQSTVFHTITTIFNLNLTCRIIFSIHCINQNISHQSYVAKRVRVAWVLSPKVNDDDERDS